jgi:hypothetical protein
MGLLESLFGGGGGGLYGDMLNPQQQQAMAQRGLLGFLGGMQKSGALDYTVPFISGKVPAGFEAGLAGGMAGMGEAQDAGLLNALRAIKTGQEGQLLKAKLDYIKGGAAPPPMFLPDTSGPDTSGPLGPLSRTSPVAAPSVGGTMRAGGALTGPYAAIAQSAPFPTLADPKGDPIQWRGPSDVVFDPANPHATPQQFSSELGAAAPPAHAVAAPDLGGGLRAGGALLSVLGPAVRAVETGGTRNPATAVSSAGAIGPGQITPATAAGYGVPKKALFDEKTNINLSDTILSDHLQRYGGDVDAALIAYNAGPRRADKFLAAGRDMSVLPKETQAYVPKVKAQMAQLIPQGPLAMPAQAAAAPVNPLMAQAAPHLPPRCLPGLRRPLAALLWQLLRRLRQSPPPHPPA